MALMAIVAPLSTATLSTTDNEAHNFANTGSHAQGVSYRIISEAGTDNMAWSVSSGGAASALAVFAPDNTGTATHSKIGIMSVGSTSHANIPAQETAEDGSFILVECNSASAQATLTLTSVDGGSTTTDSYVLNNIPVEFYGRMERSGTTLMNKFYSDSLRTSLTDTQSVTTTETTHQYFMPFASYNDSTTGTTFSGIIGDVTLTDVPAQGGGGATTSITITGQNLTVSFP